MIRLSRSYLIAQSFTLVGVLVVGASTAQAQRGNASDVTGVNITGSTTSGGAFVPAGTVLVPIPGIPSLPGVTDVVVRLAPSLATVVQALVNGEARSANGALIPKEAGILAAQLGVAQKGSAVSSICCSALGQALMSGVGAPAAPIVEQFLNAFGGVLLIPTPAAVSAAVAAWNALVNGAEGEYLARPPAEFQAVQALLLGVVMATNGAS